MDTNRPQSLVKIIIALVVLAIFGGLYVRHMKKVADREGAVIVEEPSGSPYSTQVSGYELTLSRDGMPIQSLVLGEDATAGMDLIAGSTIDIPAFITDQDVNFDGTKDVAMLIGIGYGGVNAFYDYYVFDPSTERFLKDPVLTEVGNPVFSVERRTVTANARDAQDSFTTVYSFSGTRYVKGPTISDATGTIQTED